MADFSWSDTLHACLPCFRPPSPSDEPAQQHNPSRVPNLPRDAHAALQSLLIADSESSSATEADTVSLHSNIGSGRERRRRKKNPSSSGFVLFGYHLFGTREGAIKLPESDDEEASRTDSTSNPTRHKGKKKGKKRSLGALSSSSIDSDAALVAQNAVDQATIDAFAKEERKRAKKQRKEEKKRRTAMLNIDGEAEGFEGFPESGDGSFFTEPHPHDAGLAEHGDDWNVISRIQDDPGDADVDLGGESYVRQQPRVSGGGSGSGSQTRSRTSASVSDGRSISSYNAPEHDYPSQTPMSLQESRRKERRRKKSISNKSATMSNDSSSITTASLASPSYDAQYIMSPEIMSPTSQEYHGSRFMDLGNQTNKTLTDSHANGNMFPSTRLVANRQARRSDVGVFLN